VTRWRRKKVREEADAWGPAVGERRERPQLSAREGRERAPLPGELGRSAGCGGNWAEGEKTGPSPAEKGGERGGLAGLRPDFQGLLSFSFYFFSILFQRLFK